MSIMFLAFVNPEAAYCKGDGIWYNLWEKEIAWGLIIIYAFIVAFTFFKRAAQSKSSSSYQHMIFNGYGCFVIGYMIARILFIFSDIERWNNCKTTLHVQFVMFSYTAGIFSAILLLYVIEGDILNFKRRIITKFYFSLAIVALFMAIFASFIVTYLKTIQLVNTIISSAGAGLLILLYLRMIQLSTGDVRKQAIFTFLGVALILVGSVIDGEQVITQLNIPIWVPVIFPLVGFTLIYWVQKLIGKSVVEGTK